MGKYRMLLKAAVKEQKGSVIGIFLLVFVLALCLISALTVYISGTDSVAREMRRLCRFCDRRSFQNVLNMKIRGGTNIKKSVMAIRGFLRQTSSITMD